MDQEASDILLGVAILIPFLIAVFAAGYVLNRFKNRKFHATWAPLVPVINGKVVDDGGGAASSWLTGTFEGRKVYAKMAPGMNRHDAGAGSGASSGLKYNHFEVGLDGVPGGCDWQVQHYPSLPGFGKEGWQLNAQDPRVLERLQQSGVLDMVRADGGAPPAVALPSVNYRANTSTLVYCEDVGPEWLPRPDRFREQLALVIRLAQVNEQVNPAARRSH